MITDHLRLIRTRAMPWEPHIMHRGSLRKILRHDPATGGYVHLRYFPPGGVDQAARVFHRTVHEGFYFLYGDYPCWEFRGPSDRTGRVEHFCAGTFMDRPAGSLHGRPPGLASATGSEFLMWSSHGNDFDADPLETIAVGFDSDPGPSNTTFRDPVIVHAEDLPWVDHPTLAGARLRRMAGIDRDSPAGLRPATLLYLPPGWQAPPARHHDATTRCWLFVQAGDVRIGLDGATHTLTTGDYLDWRLPARLSLGGTAATGIGCLVFCVGHELA